MIPGRALHRLAGTLCSRDMSERVIDAFFADFQREWLEAATFRRRASVTVRGYASFWVVLAGSLTRDAGNDRAGFAMRVLNRVALPAVMLGLLAIAFGAPSWVRAGRIDWGDAVRGMWEMSSLIAALLVARYRSRNADRRSLPAFFLAVSLAVAMVIVRRIDPGHDSAYQWVLRASVNMAWPFLIRRQQAPGPAEV
jgi:hypothetical protein